MPKRNKGDCWDIVEDKLLSISETRTGEHRGESKLAVAVIVSAGRDEDIGFLQSDDFLAYCGLADLDPSIIRDLILKGISEITAGRTSAFTNLLEVF